MIKQCAMAPDTLKDLGTACLKANQGDLRVLGKKQKYDKARNPRRICHTYKRSLESFDEKELRQKITLVIAELASLRNGFVPSEPDPNSEAFLGTLTIVDASYGDLALRFGYGGDISTLEHIFHIACWYYPGPES